MTRPNSEKFQNFHFQTQIVIFEGNFDFRGNFEIHIYDKFIKIREFTQVIILVETSRNSA